jgi:lipopolysaccharide/colanic/teichoic acid biosynthesis glycosyltransferase
MRLYKRFIDLIILLVFFPLILSLILIVYLYLKIKISSPVFFIQVRSGYKGKPFNLYKFRTMALPKKEHIYLNEKKRVLRATYYLRILKLDELPQFFNILRGDLTIVGPRPLLVEYNKIYNAEQKKRLHVMPGLTGWAQINGANNISWKKKFELDLYYIKNMSFYLDIKIIILTFIHIVNKISISKKKNEKIIAEKFNGRN